MYGASLACSSRPAGVNPSGLHLLLTYQCTMECDHCFVWGSPEQRGTMSLKVVREVLRQAKDAGGIRWIYFEGGEPFLFYALLVKGVRMAARAGFQVGVVSNGYWATTAADATECLRPFQGLVQDLSISCDPYHGAEELDRLVENARVAAEKLRLPCGTIRIARPEDPDAAARVGQLPSGESAVMYRGRAAEKLVGRAPQRRWTEFDQCPYENLRHPERVHIDSFGYVHVCDGITIGNLFRTPLRALFEGYDPDTHPIVAPLLAGGPAELARRYDAVDVEACADACHLCYVTRVSLRGRFPETLGPAPMYGVPSLV